MKHQQQDVRISSYRCIGRGNCGSVWALEDGQDWVYKREDGMPGRSVQNDHDMHKRVLGSDNEKDSISNLPVQVGRSYEIFEATDDELWRGTGFDPCRTYRMERIPAMPQPVRQALIDTYCHESLRDTVSNNPADDDCLIRVYLGRRRIRRHSSFQRFSLRNYPLHVDQMEELGLDTHGMAQALADTLAHCFWKVCVDLNDVEFVLAPDRDEQTRPRISSFKAFGGGRYPIWMLDYDCCRHMSQDAAGVDQAMKAFYRNDPYFPRPYAHGYTDEDGLLWRTFRTRFLETSQKLLKEGPKELATLFIEQVEEEGRSRRKRGSREIGEVSAPDSRLDE